MTKIRFKKVDNQDNKIRFEKIDNQDNKIRFQPVNSQNKPTQPTDSINKYINTAKQFMEKQAELNAQKKRAEKEAKNKEVITLPTDKEEPKNYSHMDINKKASYMDPRLPKKEQDNTSFLADAGNVAGGTLVNTGVQIGTGVVKGSENLFDAAMQFGSSEYNPMMQIMADDLTPGEKAKNIGINLIAGPASLFGGKDTLKGRREQARINAMNRKLLGPTAEEMMKDPGAYARWYHEEQLFPTHTLSPEEFRERYTHKEKNYSDDFDITFSEWNLGNAIKKGLGYKKSKDIESKQGISKEIIERDATAEFKDKLGYNKVLSNGKTIEQTLDDNSLVKSNNFGGQVAQGLGQMLPSMMLGAKYGEVGSLSLMGIEAYGSGVEEAYKNGATREEATNYGVAKAIIAMSTEKMFAGVGGVIGKGALDDAIKNKLTQKMSDGLFKTMINVGIDVTGEGIEEVAEDLLEPIALKLTYMSEADLKKLYEDQDYWNDFLSGAVTSAVMQGIDASSNIRISRQSTNNIAKEEKKQAKQLAKENKKALKEEAKSEKAKNKQKSEFKKINEEIEKNKSAGIMSLEERLNKINPEAAEQLESIKDKKTEQPTEKSKTTLTEIVDEQEGKELPKKETTESVKEEKVEQPKKDFNEQVKDIAKQYNVDAKTLKSSGIKDIDKIETVAKAMNKQNYNTTVKDLAKKYGVGVSVLKSTKITDAKELESVAKTLSTKTEAEIEAPKKAKELPKKETKQVKTEKAKVEEVKAEKIPEPTEATQEDIDHLFKKTPHMTEGEKQAKAQTKNKNQLYESAKYFNEQASTSGAKFNIKNSDIQKALDSYVQYKEAGGKKTIENLERLRRPAIVEKAKENADKTKTLPKKEQTTKKDFKDKLTALMDVQKAMEEDTGKTTKLPKAVSVENTQTKKTEKTEKVAKETTPTKKITKPVEEAKTTKKAESLPKTDEQIDAEIKEMAQKGVTTTKADINTRQMFMESRARTLDRQISNMRSSGNASDINTFIDNNIKQYEQLLADGGKKIPAYEEFKAKYQPKKEDSVKKAEIEKDEANKIVNELKGKTTIAAMSNRNAVKVIKPEDFNKKSKSMKVSNEKPINIADVANKIDLYEDDIDLAETPKNSNLLTEYKELPTKKTPVDNDIISQIKTQVVNQQHPIEEMDKKNRNYEGEQAYVRYRLSPSEGAVQVTRAQTDLDGKAIGKSILQLKKEYFDGLNKEAQEIFTTMAHLRRDLGIEDYQTNYTEDGEYVDNVFSEYSHEYKKEALEILKKAYPALSNHLDRFFEDASTYYKNENANLVESGYLPKTTDVSVKYAKEKMNMTQDEINANRNKDGSVKVPTVDYYSAMNPDYFHIVRVTDKNSSNISTTKSSVSVKGPQGLKEGASKYDIQPIFDGMADGAINNRKLMRLNQLLETIAKNDKTFENNQIPPTDLIEKDENGNEKIVKMGNDYYIKYRESGKNKAAKITKSMYESISNSTTIVDKLFNMDKEDIKNLDTKKKKALFKTLKGVRAVNKIEKMALTTLKPAFVVWNTVKDFGEALINTNYNVPRFTAEYIKSAIELPANTKYAREFKNTGLYQDSGYYTYTNKKGIEKQNPIVRNTVGRMEQIAAYSEAVARYTEYRLARIKGLSASEAIRQAKRVTVNFDRRGKLIGTMDRNFTKFIGAAQAGMNTMYDNIIGNNIYAAQAVMRKAHGEELTTRDIQEIKKSGKTLVRVTLAGMLPSLYNSLMFGSDDDKEWLENNVPEYIRDKAYIIRVGKNNYIPIYYARSQVVYKTALEEAINKDSLGTKAKKTFASFMENIAPNNPIETTKTYELISALNNEDYYKNKLYEDDDTLLEKVKKVALKRAKSYGGLLYDVGDWINTSEKSSTNKIPLVNILVKDTNDLVNVRQQSYNYSDKFWDKRNKYKESKDEKKNIIAKSMYDDYKEYVKPIADQIKIAKETGASDKELKKLYAKQRDTYRSILEDESEVYSYTGGYYYKGHNYKYTVDKNGKVSYPKQR